jgi:hypothetical protein
MLDSPPSSPAAELKRLRLMHRARGMERVLFMLRERHRERSLVGPVPAALSQAIAGFSEELGRIRLQVAMIQLTGERPEICESGITVTGKART